MSQAPRLSQVRTGRGVRQRDVASALAVSRQRVSTVESTPVPALQVGTLASYVRAVGGRLMVGVELPGAVVPLWWDASAASRRRER
ncbi:hypothetical protein [Streptomyces sp. TR02-1]|uniref:hypothetical protein n=1 Tax=Streptomyces sp. TR02-1 TaxID=3385977 RepID=UPI0039A0FE57